MHEKFFIKSSSGNNLSCSIDRSEQLPKQGVVLLTGGFGAAKNSEKYCSLSSLFQNLGYAVMRMDFSGCGQSEGDLTYSTISVGLKDYDCAIDYLYSQSWVNKKDIGVYGNSYGGCLTNLYASKNDIFRFIIFIAPCINYLELYEKLDIKTWEKEGFIKFVNVKRSYALYEDSLKYQPYEEASKIKSKCLIIHSIDDEIVPFSQSQKLKSLIEDSELVPLKGLNHSFSQNFNLVLDEVKNWMLKIKR